jgi:sugar O-acyltransferase (sialic acid O-acetyltransferase NeuD family)
MTELYIIGTGGAAKEIIQLVEQLNASKPQFRLEGIVDVKPENDEIKFFGEAYSLYEETFFLKEKQGAAVVIANGTAAVRKNIFNKYQGFQFPNIIHPNVDVHKTVRMGKGNIIKIACVLTVDIVLGDNNYINRGVQIGHDVVLGSHNVLNPGSILSGGVVCVDANNFGAHSTVLQYLTLGDNNTLGAGGVLTKNIEHDQLLLGVPAKIKGGKE